MRRIGLNWDSKWMLVSIMVFGVALRVVAYLHNRSLWVDEAMLALNLIHRSFSELLQPLDYSQGAPVGFLLIEKVFITLWGSGEYVLRLLPLLCGVASMLLFLRLARICLPERFVVFAVLLFAVSDRLIYYSSEVKQYSTDVWAALICYLMAFSTLSGKFTYRNVFAFGLAGGVLIWLSHPAVFLLAGTMTALFMANLMRRDWKQIIRLTESCSIWLTSFAATYMLSLYNLSKSQHLHDYWSSDFMPLPPRSISDIIWFIASFFEYFLTPAGFLLSGLAATLFIIGCISMYLRSKETLFVLYSPLAFTLIASGMGHYPFTGRLLLFLTPFVLIVIAEGLGEVKFRLSDNARHYGIIIAMVLLVQPVGDAIFKLFKPQEIENIRPVLNYVSVHREIGDSIYLYHGAIPAFRYYSRSYGLDKDMIIYEGINYSLEWKDYIQDLKKLSGKGRVWILFSHIVKQDESNEANLFQCILNSEGNQLLSHSAEGTAVHLYEMK